MRIQIQEQKLSNSLSSYKLINIILAGVILTIFIYSGFFYDSSLAVACVYKATIGVECAACGLTRDIDSFLSLNFNDPINSNSLNIFLFFLLQLFARITLSIPKREFITMDVILSALAFLYCFLPFFYK